METPFRSTDKSASTTVLYMSAKLNERLIYEKSPSCR